MQKQTNQQTKQKQKQPVFLLSKGEQPSLSVLLCGSETACQLYSRPHTVLSISSLSGAGPTFPWTPESPTFQKQ